MRLPKTVVIFPKDFVLQFCGPTGADGTEAAIKLAKTYTGRDNVIAFSGGYHGMTHGALAMTGNLSAKQKLAISWRACSFALSS